jgi:hypothetical protein
MKTSIQVPAISFINNINNQHTVQNPKGIDFNNIIIRLDLQYMKDLSFTYQERKKWFPSLFELSITHERRIEHLLIHSYDIRISERKNDRSMQNTKLIDLLEGSLHSTNDYLLVIRSIINIPEIHAYLDKNIFVAPMDYPGQKNVRRAIVHRMTNGEQSNIPLQILNIIPFIGPLHISLNSRETVFLINYSFFERMYHATFGLHKILAKKPKPYRINLLLELAFKGWSLVRKSIKGLFYNCKDPEAQMFINLLDNVIPLVLDFYPIIFRSGCWEVYEEAMLRIWIIFYQYRRRNYNKLPLAFLSDIFYWQNTKHPIAEVLKNSLHIFNDYYVENFHSSIRHQTNSFNTAQQIINQAKVIDQMRGMNDKNSFTKMFSNHHNIIYTEKQLEFLEKKTAIFLLDLFQNVWKNRGCTTKKKVKKYWQFNLPTLGKTVDEKVLSTGWSSSCHPRSDRLCDWDKCTLSSKVPGGVLSCGHGYHVKCFNQVNQKCPYCYEYLCDGIKYHCKIFQNTLNMEFDNNVDEDSSEDQADYLEDSNSDEMVFTDENINRKLEEALKSFKLSCR